MDSGSGVGFLRLRVVLRRVIAFRGEAVLLRRFGAVLTSESDLVVAVAASLSKVADAVGGFTGIGFSPGVCSPTGTGAATVVADVLSADGVGGVAGDSVALAVDCLILELLLLE